MFIEPGSPWENGYCESFNDKLRDECLNGEIFDSLKEARVVIEMWRKHYNTRRPHSALGYRPPAASWVAAQTRELPKLEKPAAQSRDTLSIGLVQNLGQVIFVEVNARRSLSAVEKPEGYVRIER